MQSSSGKPVVIFYQFLGLHSLLIGLFPFFIPVYLWNQGYSLADLSLLIAVSGGSFCVFLRTWETAASLLSLRALFATTLTLELALLSANLFMLGGVGYLILFGILNGLYNCYFWTTQRVLFVELVDSSNSGRQYGNFQIFVMVFLKAGILLGALLLEHFGYSWIMAVSIMLVAAGCFFFWHQLPVNQRLPHHEPVRALRVLRFSDSNRSRTVFVLDGLFLFLESHYWTVSLFIFSNQNYVQLGMIVIVLAVIFSILFYLTKNFIDKVMGEKLFHAAVLVYAASWLGRYFLDPEGHNQIMLMLLLCVTFFSSFFRLTFNKRFYDNARQADAREYLVIKSYYTQFSAFIIFSVLALVLREVAADHAALPAIYLAGAVFSLLYIRYRGQRSRDNR